MNTSELVKQLCKEQKITIAELARRIGQSRQNLYKKLQRETLSIDEIKQMLLESFLNNHLRCQMVINTPYVTKVLQKKPTNRKIPCLYTN